MNGIKIGTSGVIKIQSWLRAIALSVVLLFVAPAIADELHVYYINDDNEAVILIIDANSSDADNELAATLILEGSKILIVLDGKEDLEAIAVAVSAHAPDEATTTAISNTILGVGAYLGGRSVERTAQETDTPPVQVDTPPLPPPAPAPPSPASSVPAPSSSVASPN